MKHVVGVFASRGSARKTYEDLREGGIPEARLSLLTPDSTRAEIDRTKTSDTEQHGMGGALGASIGAGLGVGAGVALLFPIAGPVTVLGVVGTALAGIAGAAGGGAAGGALENAFSDGLPVDELFFYEDALKKGRSVLLVGLEEDGERAEVERVLDDGGAESIDAAKDEWWVGIRDAQRLEYEKKGGSFTDDERKFRRGFEAALSPRTRTDSYPSALERIKILYPASSGDKAFRDGFEQGWAYAESLSRAHETSGSRDR